MGTIQNTPSSHFRFKISLDVWIYPINKIQNSINFELRKKQNLFQFSTAIKLFAKSIETLMQMQK